MITYVSIKLNPWPVSLLIGSGWIYGFKSKVGFSVFQISGSNWNSLVASWTHPFYGKIACSRLTTQAYTLMPCISLNVTTLLIRLDNTFSIVYDRALKWTALRHHNCCLKVCYQCSGIAQTLNTKFIAPISNSILLIKKRCHRRKTILQSKNGETWTDCVALWRPDELQSRVSSLDLKALADDDPTSKAGNLFHGPTIRTEKAAFLRFNRKCPWCNSRLCPRSLEHSRRVKNSSMGRSKEPLDRWQARIKSPQWENNRPFSSLSSYDRPQRPLTIRVARRWRRSK